MPRSSCRITLFYVNAAVSFAARTGLFYCYVFFKKIILLEFHTALEHEGHEWSTALVEAELQVASIKECPALSQSSNIPLHHPRVIITATVCGPSLRSHEKS